MSSIINSVKGFLSSLSMSISPTDENYHEKLDEVFELSLNHFDNNNKGHYCVAMYYDLEDGKSHIKILNKDTLCNMLFGILQQVKDYYEQNPKRSDTFVELECFQSCNYPDFKVLSFLNVYGDIIKTDTEQYFPACRSYIACNDFNAVMVIDALLKLCQNRDDISQFLRTLKDKDDMLNCFNVLYGKYDKLVKKDKKEKIPREETPREEIPREKTLSKKEKEKLKKQKAKEANKLREQQKKDKAKLAEQQAKQFEKQQKERNKKRIETERKKKLALLKK